MSPHRRNRNTSAVTQEEDAMDVEIGSDFPSPNCCPSSPMEVLDRETSNHKDEQGFHFCFLYLTILLAGGGLAVLLLFYGMSNARNSATRQFELDGT